MLCLRAVSSGGAKKADTYTRKHLDEIRQLYSDQDEAAIGVIAMIAHNLVNAIEDVYIESRMCESVFRNVPDRNIA